MSLFRNIRRLSKLSHRFKLPRIKKSSYTSGIEWVNTKYWGDSLNDASDAFKKMSKDNTDKLIKSGTEQAVKSLNTAQNKLVECIRKGELQSNEVTVSVTFNVGLIQIGFSNTTLITEDLEDNKKK